MLKQRSKKENYLKKSMDFTDIMELVQQENKEQCVIIKPAIKTPLLLLQSFITTLQIYFITFFGWLFLLFYSIFTFIFLLDEAGFGVALISVITPFLVIMFIVFLLKRASLKRTEYKFCSDRIEYYEGFLVKNRKTINYDKITYIGQRKRILEGLFNLGTIFIDTPGSDPRRHELELGYLENPDKIYNWISKITTKVTAKKE